MATAFITKGIMVSLTFWFACPFPGSSPAPWPELLAARLQLGDVGVVKIRDVRNRRRRAGHLVGNRAADAREPFTADRSPSVAAGFAGLHRRDGDGRHRRVCPDRRGRHDAGSGVPAWPRRSLQVFNRDAP